MEKNDVGVISHPGKKLNEVMSDIFHEYPEESFYFLNEGTLKRTIQIFQENFLPQDYRRRIAYAVKANPNPVVLKTLSTSGINSFDCASLQEIKTVQSISPKAEIFFNNPHKKRTDIINALEKGVTHFTADLPAEVDKILSIQEIKKSFNTEIAIRLKTLNSEGSSINLSERFGATKEVAREIFQRLKSKDVLPCISMNLGSQVFDINSYQRHIIQLFEFIKLMRVRLFSLNVGGGIPVLSQNSVEENQALLTYYLEEISSALSEKINDILKDTDTSKIIIEPGRSMIASSVDLGVSVLNNHAPFEKSITIDDGVFTSFTDSAIHSWKYEMYGINNKGERIKGETDDYSLYGRTCDSGDVIHNQRLVSGLTSKDYIHIPNAGAYLSSQSTQFNGYKPHTYVLYNS